MEPFEMAIDDENPQDSVQFDMECRYKDSDGWLMFTVLNIWRGKVSKAHIRRCVKNLLKHEPDAEYRIVKKTFQVLRERIEVPGL